ncbi:DoxX family protein [Pseudonocardia spinosispora]|uniref:DoxX family protein n=1 Tax=Pseudonocardia spinosispora TaxID=103441 RepID=UPI00040E1681|nr:DoxX family protein [Pseudonocardia spinosispora]
MSAPTTGTTKTWNIVLWVLQVLGAVSFLFAGYQKLSGDPQMVALFTAIGWGQWFRYLTGTLEILGALALLIPRLRALGALGLIGVMIGAIITSVALGATVVPALGELVIVAIIAWGRRRELNPAWVLRGSRD